MTLDHSPTSQERAKVLAREQFDIDMRVPLAQPADFAVLFRYQLLAYGGGFDIEILLRQEKVG